MAKKQTSADKLNDDPKTVKLLDAPLVSIVMATYNHGAYLPETLGSILAQTYKNLEIIVIDDGSTDNTRQVLAAYPSVKYFYQENQGSSSAFNVGIRMSHGEFYITPGADDCLDAGYVERCLAEMMKDRRTGFVWTGTQEFGESHEVRTPKPLLNRISIYRGTGGQLGAALFRRKAFEDVGGYDENLHVYEDWDIAIRMVQCGWKGRPIKEPIYFWRRHKSSRNTAADPAVLRGVLEKKYPRMKLYASLARGFDLIALLFTDPKAFFKRLYRKMFR